MLATITGSFVNISVYDFKNEKGEALKSYKVLLMDEDEVVDSTMIKTYKVMEKALVSSKLLDEATKKQVMGKSITLHGRFLPKYRANSKVWEQEFKAESITL